MPREGHVGLHEMNRGAECQVFVNGPVWAIRTPLWKGYPAEAPARRPVEALGSPNP
jgi:hypothetical protein